jgi:hypothetical protein
VSFQELLIRGGGVPLNGRVSLYPTVQNRYCSKGPDAEPLMAKRFIMQHIMPMDMWIIQRTRMGNAPESLNFVDQSAMGMTRRNPVPTIANVASESRSKARGAIVMILEFRSWTMPSRMADLPRDKIYASIKA